ncbi:hypothetical protein PICSAR248_02249 [Mycobacterium avium subsp. paratuberculosis]|nr:hypothetical protein PICSAR248_02249 [Mycobacterium avium subsp. paratuberculosis]
MGLLWRARTAKGRILRNVRKTLILAAVTGTLVTIPSATAHADAEQVGFDPNVPAAGREEQIRVAENVLHSQGIGAWPVCGRRG